MSNDARDPPAAGGDGARTGLGGPVAVAGAVVRAVRAADATFVAGSLAYYSGVATLPVAVLAAALVTHAGDGVVASGAVTAGGELLTPRGRTFLRGSIGDVSRRRGIVVVAGALACFSVVQLFRGLDRAFAAVYGVEKRGVRSRVRDTLFALAVGGLGVLAVLLAAGALSLYTNESLVRAAVPLAVLLLSTVGLFPLFYALPATPVSRAEVLPGTLVAAVGWTVTGAVLGAYADAGVGVGIYGSFGGLLVLVAWFYAANLLVLVGAATNAVLAGHV
ncbi:YihY/virulence factor BrkB family protein [Halobaculum magnesiiphilum]|uniref:YihY/virulence factor BrkB family protein n=1 Tax=Halobaculum magnesiiphilum TaxID=1017351 RepID=A0A8T8W9U9_9EURY|nr:YihY/virulence factor BrkB family protein [Halobaculum magnesiiphilum]QZP36615.1 YihY/virulence factor BrkB family protein [Halobaculum magnesiiphilum]